jgi:hypothetical protein
VFKVGSRMSYLEGPERDIGICSVNCSYTPNLTGHYSSGALVGPQGGSEARFSAIRGWRIRPREPSRFSAKPRARDGLTCLIRTDTTAVKGRDPNRLDERDAKRHDRPGGGSRPSQGSGCSRPRLRRDFNPAAFHFNATETHTVMHRRPPPM